MARKSKSGDPDDPEIGSEERGYEVGYAKPPQEHQFKPGHKSKGGRRKRTPDDIIYLMEKALMAPVVVQDQKTGRRRKVPYPVALTEKTKQLALAGNRGAAKTMIELFQQFGLADIDGATFRRGMEESRPVDIAAKLEAHMEKIRQAHLQNLREGRIINRENDDPK